MEWLFGLGLIAFFAYFVVYKLGNKKFWDIAQQHPNQALEYFQERPEWYINEKPTGVEVTGPFLFVAGGTTYKIYGEPGKIETSQEEFIRSVSS